MKMNVQPINSGLSFNGKPFPELRKLRKQRSESILNCNLKVAAMSVYRPLGNGPAPKVEFSEFGITNNSFYPNGVYKRIEVINKNGSRRQIYYCNENGYCYRSVDYKNNEKVGDTHYRANYSFECIFKDSKLVRQIERKFGRIITKEFDENENLISTNNRNLVAEALDYYNKEHGTNITLSQLYKAIMDNK